MSLWHISIASRSDIRPGNLTAEYAGKLADALELEAFLHSEDGQWYGFSEDEDDTVRWFELSPALWQRLATLGNTYEDIDP